MDLVQWGMAFLRQSSNCKPKKIAIDIVGEASVLMTTQEMLQFNILPQWKYYLNNEYISMVRQWQELHDKNYSKAIQLPYLTL